MVEFQFDVVPTATLHNQTDLGFNIGAEISLLSVELGYDIEMASDSTTLGPLAEFGGTRRSATSTCSTARSGSTSAKKTYSGSPEPPRSGAPASRRGTRSCPRRIGSQRYRFPV